MLRPLVNRGEDRLIYIRQSAPGIGEDNSTFSIPEINDIKSRVKTISAFGDFSTTHLTFAGLDLDPRTVKAGVVGGDFFESWGFDRCSDGCSPGETTVPPRLASPF